jgi:lysophospholipase L1-like esterase
MLLCAALLLAGGGTGIAQTTNSISIANHSFEAQSVTAGSYAVETPTGWNVSGPSAGVVAIVNPAAGDTRFASYPPPGLDGVNFCQVYSTGAGDTATVYQDTGVKYQSGATYTLEGYFGRETNAAPNSQLVLYNSSLVAIASNSISGAALTQGSFTSETVTYTATGNEGGNGDIVVGFNTTGAAAVTALDFDNVSLVAVYPPGPAITNQPVSAGTLLGQTNSFSVGATTSSGTPLQYQWQASPTGVGTYTNLVNGGQISGATSNVLTISGVTAGWALSYRVVVTNSLGAVTSSPASLTLYPTSVLINGDFNPGTPQAGAAVLGSPGDVWNAMSGATGTLLSSAGNTLGGVGFSLNNSGQFYTDTGGSAMDAATTPLMEEYAFGYDSSGYSPTVTLNLTGLTPYVGSAFTLEVYAAGDTSGQGASLTLTGASGGNTASTLTTTATSRQISAGAGVAYQTFTGILTNGTLSLTATENAGQVFTCMNGFQLQLGPPPDPGIATGPVSQTTFTARTVSFSVTAAGTAPFSYQWQAGVAGVYTNLANGPADGAMISGATSNVLTLANVTIGQALEYVVIVTNSVGSITSAPATLTVATNGQNFVVNGSFEEVNPSVTSDTYTVNFGTLPDNVATGWTMGTSAVNNGYDGIAAATGRLSNKAIEDGTNAVFIQGSGYIYQAVTLPAGTYILQFYAMGRAGADGVNLIAVTLGNQAWTATPANTEQTSLSNWTLYSYSFTVATAGTYTLEFTGTLPYGASGDHTTYIDKVSIMAATVIPPAIISEPSPVQMVYAGQNAQFTVQASGVPNPSYQWQVGTNGIYVNLTNGGSISGATNATLSISNVSPADPTNFMVSVFNSGGTTNSTSATLTVLPLPGAGAVRAFVTVINPSFEDSQQAGDIYTSPYGILDPQTGVPGWQFNASGGDSYSGIGTEFGTLLGSPKYVPQGWQAAFIQGTGQFSQPVTFNTAGTYVIRFRACGLGSASGGAGAETIAVSVDGNSLGTFTPGTTATQWTLFTSNPFNVAAGVHVLAFAGTVPYTQSERTSFIDDVQIVTPAEAVATVPPISPVYDIVFIGDSITYGATLANPSTQAAPVQCQLSLGQRYNVAVNLSNQGQSGTTTVDWQPSSTDFQLAIAGAAALESNQPGQLIFSIMLGVNDSAQSGPDGSPVSPANFQGNLQSIINQLLVDYPNALVFVQYPTWYSPNTQNSSLYGAAGLALLESYFPEIDQLISNNATLHPGLVFAGDKLAFNFFSTNYLTDLTPESGAQGTFYLHPNQAGAVVLGGFWANAIAGALNFTTNDSYVAWLQSGDLTPGAPGTGFSDTPMNALVSNGVSYGNPDGLLASLANNPASFNVTGDIRNDAALNVVLQSSTNLVNWIPINWSNSPSQSGVATGFIRHLIQDQSVSSQNEKFYRVQLNY